MMAIQAPALFFAADGLLTLEISAPPEGVQAGGAQPAQRLGDG
jgi:hypothetical protein